MFGKLVAVTVSAAAIYGLTQCDRVQKAYNNFNTSMHNDEIARQRGTYTSAMNKAQTESRGFKKLTAMQLAEQIDASGTVKPPVDVLIKAGFVNSAHAYSLQRPTVAACLAVGQTIEDSTTVTCIDQSNRPLLRVTVNGNDVRPGF